MARPRAIPDPVPLPGSGGRPPKRRDRRGRGMRGQLLPRTVPAWRSRADRFDDLVLDAVERLEARWARELDGVEFAVEDVPPSDPSPWEHGEVPLGRFFPADGALPPRIVVYRRPVETRAADAQDIGELAQSVVVEQVAHLLNLTPEEVDPRYNRDS
ncbi:metallopeptidase family protein [Kineosporia mesophila]|nr:metallopeptidase family protein [Kineosporia mesophila]